MRDEPRRILGKLLILYGPDLHLDVRRTEALLRDYCPDYTREIFLLVNAQRQRVASDLLAAPVWMPRQALKAQLVKRLEDELCLTPVAAAWAVAAWADALRIEPTPPGRIWIRLKQHAPSPEALWSRGRRMRQWSRAQWRQIDQLGVQFNDSSPTLCEASKALWRFVRALWRRRGLILRRPVGILLLVIGSAWVTTASVDEWARPATLLSASSELLAATYPPPRPAWVSAGPLIVRSGPSLASAPLGLLQEHEQVTVVAFSVDGLWAAIERPATGWVSNRFLHYQSERGAYSTVLALEQATVTNESANLRAGPGLEHPIVGGLPAGQPVLIVATDAAGSWKEIALPVRGWINRQLVDIQEEPNSQP